MPKMISKLKLSVGSYWGFGDLSCHSFLLWFC